MSVLERELKSSINELSYYILNQNLDYKLKFKAIELFDSYFNKINSNIADIFKQISTDMLIQLAETAFPLQECIDKIDILLKIYFEQENTKNNFYIKALLLKARLEYHYISKKGIKAEDSINELKNCLNHIFKALEIISKPENKQKYSFLVYNASVYTYNILKSFFKYNWSKNFFEILEKISNFLEEIEDIDFNWRIRFLIKLIQCYLDADKKPEAAKALDKISEIIKKKGDCEFAEELFRYRIHFSRENSAALVNIKKEADAIPEAKGFKYFYTLQSIKSGVIPENMQEKEFQLLVTQVFPDFNKHLQDNNSSQSIKIDTWRADILAETGFLMMRSKFVNMAQQVYDFLQRVRTNSLKGKLYIENLKAQLILNKLETVIFYHFFEIKN
jgi:hypothetical protein